MNRIIYLVVFIFTCSCIYGQEFKKVKSKSKHAEEIISIACNDNYFATSSYDKSIIVWNYDGRIIYKHKLLEGKINSLLFIPKSNSLMVGMTEKNNNSTPRFIIKSFDINGNQENEFIDPELTQEFVNEFYKNNTVSEQNTLNSIKKSFPTLSVVEGLDIPQAKNGLSHLELIQHIAISPEGTTIASIDKFNILNIWSKGGKLLKNIQINNHKKDTQIYFTSEAELLITPNIFLDINSLDTKLIDGFEMYSSIIFDDMIYFFFDYNDKSRTEKLFQLESKSVKEMDKSKFYSFEAARSKTKLSLLGTDGLIRVIDSEGTLLSTFGREKKETSIFRGERLTVFSNISKIGFSPDGRHIVSGDENGKVVIWKAQLN
ncbi:hypothetical protein [Spongiimicrobium sp. 2-473A-2-J]|uniref:hypothetical protein n=1 Tax=Eudoraea algarum TaxID=3417568 RepID=UPI003D369A7D